MARFSTTWEAVGMAALQAKLAEAIGNTGDLRPVWNDLDERFTERHLEQFEDEGEIAGTPGRAGWAELDPEYAARKESQAGVQEGIMVRTGALLKSMVNPFDPNAVRRATKTSYERGTSLLYAAAHQEGAGDLPKRPVLVFNRDDREWLTDRLGEHIIGPFEG